MLGSRPLATAPLATLAIKPARTSKKLREQLQQMRGEMPPPLLARWGHVIDAAIKSLQGRGPKPQDGNLAQAYLQEQVDQGRDLNASLVTEAAREMLCSRRTAERAAKKVRRH
jgi:hypothetical protein